MTLAMKHVTIISSCRPAILKMYNMMSMGVI